MAIKNRADLKSFFVKNAIPTEGNFADLIDSQLNQAQDGVFKLENEPLSVVASGGDQKRALRLYGSYPAANPDWMISLNPAQDPANPATARPGFGITDGAGRARLFVDAATGRVGLGTNTPQAALEVAGDVRATGEVRANGFRGRNDLVLSDYRTVNPSSNVCVHSPPNDRDAWIYRDAADAASNWGIYHRQIDAALGALPRDSIAFVGGGASKLQAYVSLADGSGFFAGALAVNGDVALGGKHAFRASDAYLRLNQDGAFGSGVHTPRNLTAGRIGINVWAPSAALDLGADSLTWGGWLEAIRFSRQEHSAITHPGGKLLFGLHSDRNFYFADTNAGRYVMTISGASGVVGAPFGVKAGEIGIGTQLHGATTYPYETIQMNPAHNLRLWFGRSERFAFCNDGTLQITFAGGYWKFQADGNLVKYRSDGTVLWALNKVSGHWAW